LTKYIINIIQKIVINEYSKCAETISKAIMNCDKNLTILDKEYLSSRKPMIAANESAYMMLFENSPINISRPNKIAIPPDEGICLLCKLLLFGIETVKGFFISANDMIAVVKKDMKYLINIVI
jgi:hypothetical protein|tara:strand:+ start:183 stop:551 length:369 start_codon:yes stop_codon:yes gene_type:complete